MMIWGILVFLAVGIATCILGARTDILRDAAPIEFGQSPFERLRRPYSLAQSQMAWWFAIIIASFVYIAAHRLAGGASLNVHLLDGILNPQSLVLLGIGTGTALGAAIVEQSKDDPRALAALKSNVALIASLPVGQRSAELTDQRTALAQRLASENFLKDILTDEDGVSLHRFQQVAWTLVLGVIFVAEVVTSGGMPVFDPLILAVLGISGGTYLGFKVPEQPA